MKSSHSHAGFLEYAKEFARAACAAAAVDANQGARMRLAICYLCGHAIELALKSVLKLNGATDKSLKFIGHDLEQAFSAANCLQQKRFLNRKLSCAVRMLNPYYSGKELEYFTQVGGMRLPERDALIEIMNKLITDLDREYRTLSRKARDKPR